MKQLARLTTLLMLLLVGAGFTSCGDDDDEEGSSNSAIVGTWKNYYSYEEGDCTQIFTFKADGTGTFYIAETYYGETYDDTIEFTYSYGNGILTLVDDDGYTEKYKVTISGNKFTIDYGEEDEPEVFVRV